MLAFHCWIWLASSNQRKYKRHRISDLQGLLASSSSLSSKRVLCHCIASNFLHCFSWRFWRIDANRLKILLMLTERLQDVFVWLSENRKSGASDHQKKNKKSLRRIRPRRFPPPLRVQNALRFPEPASVFQWRNVYVLQQVWRTHASFKAR